MTKQSLVVADDLVVRLDYTLTLSDGEIYDSSEDSGPLEYLQGHGQLIPGLEQALYDMAVDEEKDVVVTPDVGYGEYDPDAVQELPLDMFPPNMDLEAGMSIDLYDEDADEEIEAIIDDIGEDSVTVNFNHPLAGETLNFHVRIVGIRPATPEELDHGHAHVDGHSH
ncbi:MAG: peptidylprolyl isomerase [Caldilineaceae bacterium]